VTIDEAIEILDEIARSRSFTRSKEPTDAIKLAIEALKRVKEARKKVYFTSRSLLPGEIE